MYILYMILYKSHLAYIVESLKSVLVHQSPPLITTLSNNPLLKFRLTVHVPIPLPRGLEQSSLCPFSLSPSHITLQTLDCRNLGYEHTIPPTLPFQRTWKRKIAQGVVPRAVVLRKEQGRQNWASAIW